MRVIRKSVDATEDALAIWEYVGADDVVAADRLIERFDAKLATLAATPGIGTPRPELGRGVRSVVVGHFVLYYRPIERGISLIRILHGARDLQREWRG